MPEQKRETPLTGKTKDGHVLTEQEELFCNLYVQNLGNGKEAAEEVYNVDKTKSGWAVTCASIASENLRKPHLLQRIREILDLAELNDETVDSELNFLVKQKDNLSAKGKGIDIFNRMKGRYKADNDQVKPTVVINVEREKKIIKALDDL